MRFLTVLICFLIICPAALLIAQDYPGWRGENRDGKVSGFNVPPYKWPVNLKQQWQVQVGEGDASPVLVDGKIFLHVLADSNEVATCVDAANGNEIWRRILNPAPEVTGPAASHPGPRSTPVVSKGKMISLGAGGAVTCLNTKNGEVLWTHNSFKEVPRFFTGSSPMIMDKICIVQLGGSQNGAVVALDMKTGDEVWKLEQVPCTYSSPVAMSSFDNLILVQSETDLLGVSGDGDLLWKIPTPAEQRFYNSPSPVFEGNTIVIAGQGLGTRAFSLEKTGENWTVNELWHNQELGTSFATPLVKNGYIYGNEHRMGYLFCLDLVSGNTSWKIETPLNRFGYLLDLGSQIASFTAYGTLVIFEPNGKEYKETANYKISENEVYASPVFSGDHIFIKDKQSLTCWSVK